MRLSLAIGPYWLPERRLLCPCVLVAVLSCSALVTMAAPRMEGTVTALKEDIATVAIKGDRSPLPGDPVQFSTKIGSTRIEAGRGTVLEVEAEGSRITVRITEGIEKVNINMVADIEESTRDPALAMASSDEGSRLSTAGLIAHYKFDGDVQDAAPGASHGRKEGEIEYVEGVVGRAVRFGGIDRLGLVHVPNRPALKVTDACTVTLWMRMAGEAGQTGADCSRTKVARAHQAIVSRSGDRVGWSVQSAAEGMPQRHLHFRAHAQTEHDVALMAKPVQDLDRWIHAAIVMRPDGVDFFQDATLVAQGSKPVDHSVASGEDIVVGLQAGKASCLKAWFPLHGAVDELRIYDRALSADQIKRIFDWRGPPALDMSNPEVAAMVRKAREAKTVDYLQMIMQATMMYDVTHNRIPEHLGEFLEERLIDGPRRLVSPQDSHRVPNDFDQWSEEAQATWLQTNGSFRMLRPSGRHLNDDEIFVFERLAFYKVNVSLLYGDGRIETVTTGKAEALLQRQTGKTIAVLKGAMPDD